MLDLDCERQTKVFLPHGRGQDNVVGVFEASHQWFAQKERGQDVACEGGEHGRNPAGQGMLSRKRMRS